MTDADKTASEARRRFGRLIKEARDRKKLSQQKLGEILDVSRSAVNQWESGATTPDTDRLPQLFSVLGINPDDAFPSDATVSAVEPLSHAGSGLSIDRTVTAPLRSEMPKDVPILGTVSGGSGGFQIMNGDVIDWARRPPRLNGRTDVFGLYVEDLSMMPKYEPGDLIFVERSVPARVGDYVILETKESPTAERRAILKKLAGVTSQAIRLEQYNPARTFELPRKQVIHMFRVMTVNDLLGV